MRLTGKPLIAARRFAETPVGARVLRQKIYHNYRIGELLELPAEARAPLQVHPAPLPQRSERGWPSQNLGVPTPADGRTTIRQLRRAYEEGKITPTEVLAEIERRVHREDFGLATFSPFHCLDFEKARRVAEASTQRWRDGKPLGVVDGVPLPVKDHFLMEGLRVDAGSCHLDHRCEQDAHLVDVLRDAGAMLYATTHTTEWGMDPCGFSQHTAMPRNVFCRDAAAGGSSTGTAVAVALGYAPVGIGSDGGGSIRIPSAMNGIFGLKPTFGRFGRSGDLFASSTMSVSGPLGASTADLVALAGVAAAADDPADPVRHFQPDQPEVAELWRGALGRGVDGCRIGIPRGEWDQLDSPLQRPSMDRLKRLEADGAELVDVDIELLSCAPAIGTLVIGMETLANLQDEYADNGHHFSESLRMSLSMFRSVRTDDFMAARRTRTTLREQLREVLEDVDLLALPTTQSTAPAYPADLGDAQFVDDDAIGAMTRFTFLANLTGLPAGTVPAGRRQGLPFGIQFVGGAWDEASVLAAMAHAERQGWARLLAPEGCKQLV